MSNAEVFGPNDPGPRDANYSSQNGGSNGDNRPSAKPFPWERLAFTVLFAFVAWFVFWLSLVLALAAGALRLFGVQTQDNVAAYAAKAVGYLGDVLSYVSGARDDKPFPFG